MGPIRGLLLVAACLGVAAVRGGPCSAEDAPKGAGAPKTFTFAGHCSTVDPAMISGPEDERVVLACGDGLTRIDPATGAVGPGAAESWTISPDGKTWTFKLRPATWQRRVGTGFESRGPVKASDFVYAWNRLLEPSVKSPNVHLLDLLVGVRSLSTDKPRALALNQIADELDRRVGGKEMKKTLSAEDAQSFLNDPGLHARMWLGDLEAKEAKFLLGLNPDKPYQGSMALALCAAIGKEVLKINAGYVDAEQHVGTDRGFYAKRGADKSVDESTLVVETVGLSPWLPSLLARGPLVPVEPKMNESQADDMKFRSSANQVCNGPFVCFTEFPKGVGVATHVVLHKNPTWWNAAAVVPDQIVGLVDTGTDDVLLRYGQKQCQWVLADALSLAENRAIRAAKAADWKPTDEQKGNAKAFQSMSPDAYDVPSGRVFVMRFRCAAPLDKKEQRQALASIVLSKRGEFALKAASVVTPQPAKRFVHPGTSGLLDLPRKFETDASKAAALYGKKRFADGQWISILSSSSDYDVTDVVVRAWRKEGIADEISDNAHEPSEMWSSVQAATWDVLLETWIADFDDPLAYLAPFTTGSLAGGAKWSNPVYDALIAGARDVVGFKSKPDPAVVAIPAIKAALDKASDAKGLEDLRRAMLAEAEAILLEEAVVVPLWIPMDSGTVRKGVKGVFTGGGGKRSILDPQSLVGVSFAE